MMDVTATRDCFCECVRCYGIKAGCSHVLMVSVEQALILLPYDTTSTASVAGRQELDTFANPRKYYCYAA